MAIEFNLCHWMAVEFSLCHWMATKFNHHVTMMTKNLSVTTMSFPPPTPIFYPFFTHPPNDDQNPFGHHLVRSLHKKMGLLMATHWEVEWNMLGTNRKLEKNPSLLGVKFDAIL
jgi:hypothetical protein